MIAIACAGTASHAGSAAPIQPWPYAPVPIEAMRSTTIAGAAASAFSTAIETPGDVGIPTRFSGGRVAWQPLMRLDGGLGRVASNDSDSRDGSRIFIVGHFFSPVIYREQDYRLQLTCNKQADLYVDGKLVASTDGLTPCVAAIPTAGFRSGPVRFVVAVSARGTTDIGLNMAEPGDVHFFADLPDEMNKSLHADDYPTVSISNGIVNATLAIPDPVKGYYRANRFEQAGLILSLDCRGHTYFPEAPRLHNPIDPHSPVGPCEECFDPIAYDDAFPGEPFIKFGVGLYEKPMALHGQWYNPAWPIRLFSWKTRAGKSWVEFTQDVKGPRGWRYHYVKRVVLVPGQAVMRIEHCLANTGGHEIDIEQYDHNWVNLDGANTADGYTATVPYSPIPVAPLSPSIVIDGDTISYASTGTAHLDLTGFTQAASDDNVLVSAKQSTATLGISCDQPLSHAAVYATAQSFCYEPFVSIDVKPGTSSSWTRTYSFGSR